MTALINSEKKAHIYEKCYNRRKTNSVPYNQRTQWNYAEDASSIIESTKHYHFPYSPSLPITFGASCEERTTPRIPAEITYAESDFCNYINTKINCLLGCATDTGRLGEQIYQSLLGYSTATTTRAIAETLLQQPVESDPEKYKNESNNSVTAQAKSTVNKKPRVLSPTTLLYYQTPQSRIKHHKLLEIHTLGINTSPAQNLAKSASLLIEETAILQPIGSSDKGKQPALAPREHSNMRTPISLNITSNTPPINQIMAYQDIAKLEKFSGEENNTYSWIMDAKKAITANGWNNDHTIQALLFFLSRTANLWSVRPHHLTSLQDAITLAHNFESAEQEANHTQAINLAINGTSDIDAKITQLKKIITTADTYSNRTVSNSNNLGDPILATVTTKEDYGPKSKKPIPAIQILAKHGTPIFHTSKSTVSIHTTSPVHSTTTPELLSTTTNNTNNLSLSNFPLHGLFRPIPHSPAQSRPTPTGYPNQASYLSLMEDQSFNKSTSQTKSNIPPAIITKDTILATIFLFDINNLNTHSLFSRTAINQDKPIMALYTDARVRGIDIKLILNSRLAVDCAATTRIITADGNTKTPIREIDNFSFKINGIQISTKVLIIKAIQYQALVGNNWLSKANATLD
ncbi:hypothetical protein G9A89_002472 [Geosiphon pyriformis]|nr:hypothetical protein G9A89_002472 [Geosiphon pyriformis]